MLPVRTRPSAAAVLAVSMLLVAPVSHSPFTSTGEGTGEGGLFGSKGEDIQTLVTILRAMPL